MANPLYQESASIEPGVLYHALKDGIGNPAIERIRAAAEAPNLHPAELTELALQGLVSATQPQHRRRIVEPIVELEERMEE